ncbi:MAG: hypothetical protein KC613_20335 [Myxococcales bacterium]|nr:hypothetical protein [Myxococcales bacterium]
MTSARITAAGLGFGLAHLGLAGLITFGIFGVLPSRWWLVDAPAALLTALLLAGAVGVLRRDRLGLKLARASAALVLTIGSVAFATLCIAAAFVAGVQGVLGKGVAMAYLLLILPVGTYLVLLPLVELAWLHRQLQATQPPRLPD